MPDLRRFSVDAFKKIIREATRNIVDDNRWNWDNEVDRGRAFQMWVADLITGFETTFDTEPEEAMLYSRDLGADLVFEDSANRHLLICQCKFPGAGSKLKPVDEDEVVSFFTRHDLYMNREWVRNHGSREAFELLGDYREKIENGYQVTYRFITTGRASDRVAELETEFNRRFAAQGINVKCELYDFVGLKEYYVLAQSIEASIPSEVRFHFSDRGLLEKDSPHRTVVVVVSGNTLRNLYKRHKESLFAHNIRFYLGDRGINSEIRATANNRPGEFYYLNNGISAICTAFEVDGNEIVARDFQIINGAQTIGALAKGEPHPEVEVLLRLTETTSVKTEKGFNQSIIQANNSQNAIKVSDFRANDQIQQWLEQRFTEQRPTDNLPNIRYVRKRTHKRPRGQVGLKLEDLAKIRYAFDWEPTLIYAQPRALWTFDEQGGAYEKAFGINGKIEAVWPDEIFQACLVALCFYYRYLTEARSLRTRNPDWSFLNRLKWHGLALAGIYWRTRLADHSAKAVVKNGNMFDDIWVDYWSLATSVMDDVYEQALEDEMRQFAFLRSTDRWNRMKRRFEKRVDVR